MSCVFTELRRSAPFSLPSSRSSWWCSCLSLQKVNPFIHTSVFFMELNIIDCIYALFIFGLRLVKKKKNYIYICFLFYVSERSLLFSQDRIYLVTKNSDILQFKLAVLFYSVKPSVRNKSEKSIFMRVFVVEYHIWCNLGFSGTENEKGIKYRYI